MDFLSFYFPVSGVEANILFPPLFMFFVSLFTSPGGVSGAFVLLPFQMSVLGYTSPSVTATNFIYNIVSIPLGAYKFIKEKKLSLALLSIIIIGTIPGIFMGYWIRVTYLPDAYAFKVFVGFVLLYLAFKLLKNGIKDILDKESGSKKADAFRIYKEKAGLKMSVIELESGEKVVFPTKALLIPSFITGIIGGAYGIGGGALMATYCVTVLKIPVYLMSGASLLSTWFASIISVLIYQFSPFVNESVSTTPDWFLGSLFGLGGLFGIWLGASLQKFIPVWLIKLTLGFVILFVSLKYLFPFFMNLIGA